MIKAEMHDYEITLLTSEEYMKYKSIIPHIDDYWWLRTPGILGGHEAFVSADKDFTTDEVNDFGSVVTVETVAVRPVLKFKNSQLTVGTQFIALGNRWFVFEEGAAISMYCIGCHRFDEDTNVWEESELRDWLIDWAKDGE